MARFDPATGKLLRDEGIVARGPEEAHLLRVLDAGVDGPAADVAAGGKVVVGVVAHVESNPICKGVSLKS